jgi:hypothetical protein
MAVSKVTISFLDRQSKIVSSGIYVTAMSAGNFNTLNGLIDDAVNAISAVTLLEKQKDERLSAVTKFAATPPTDDFALKGIRWLVRGVDTNGNPVTFHIGGADLGQSADGKTLDLLNNTGLALKTALDAVWKSNDGEAVVTQEVVYLDK